MNSYKSLQLQKSINIKYLLSVFIAFLNWTIFFDLTLDWFNISFVICFSESSFRCSLSMILHAHFILWPDFCFGCDYDLYVLISSLKYTFPYYPYPRPLVKSIRKLLTFITFVIFVSYWFEIIGGLDSFFYKFKRLSIYVLYLIIFTKWGKLFLT